MKTKIEYAQSSSSSKNTRHSRYSHVAANAAKMIARNFLKNLEKQVPSHRPNDSRQGS